MRNKYSSGWPIKNIIFPHLWIFCHLRDRIILLFFNTPSWPVPKFLHLLAERILPRQTVPKQLVVVFALYFYRIIRFNRRDKSINNRLFFPLGRECSEHSVPNDQNCRVIFVDAVRVAAVMDSVMAWRVENELNDPRKVFDLLGVDPELIEQVAPSMGQKNWRRKPQSCFYRFFWALQVIFEARKNGPKGR